MTRTFLSAKKTGVAATIGALTLFGGLTAAGALPGAAQDFVAGKLESVGITVPGGPDAASGGHADVRGKSATHTPGPDDATDPGTDVSTDTENGGGADTTGAQISETAHTTEATGVDKGAEISAQASDDRSQAGLDHPGAEVPPPVPASTPGQADNGLDHRPQP